MIKNSPAVQDFFKNNPKADKLFFTSNGSAFVGESFAKLHAGDLVRTKKGTATVIAISREEAFAGGAPVDTTTPLKDAVRDAQAAYDSAVNAKEAVNADTKSKQGDKLKATNAVKATEKALHTAKEALANG